MFQRGLVDCVSVRVLSVHVQLDRPARVLFFESEPNPAASTGVRARVAAGERLDGLVSPAVAQLIEERGLYR